MSNIIFKTITGLDEAKTAWNNLSPNLYLHDDWNFRYSYYKYFNYPLFFYAAYQDDELVGLLPLMLNEHNGILEFFAGFDYMENNRIFIKTGYEFLKQVLIDQISYPYNLDYMDDSMKDINGVQVHDNNFFINLSGMNSYEDFLMNYLSAERRKKIKKIILETKFTSEVSHDLSKLILLANFNKERFGIHSSFNDRPHWNEYINEITEKFNSRITTLKIDGKIEGVGLTINYKNIAYGLITGYNKDINNLGKIMILAKIEQAIKDGMDIYDSLGGGAFGWKQDFHLLTRPFYRLESK